MTSSVANRISALDPLTDCREIACLLMTCEFSWDIERALEFALFRTYAVPSISGLLARTGEFECRPRKRYDDTKLILSEILENGFDSAPGRSALARMNDMHGRFSGRIERDGSVTHLIAERVEDLSPLLTTLGRPEMIDVNDGRADETKRPVGGSVRSTAHHPREQARKLFPSRDFH